MIDCTIPYTYTQYRAPERERESKYSLYPDCMYSYAQMFGQRMTTQLERAAVSPGVCCFFCSLFFVYICPTTHACMMHGRHVTRPRPRQNYQRCSRDMRTKPIPLAYPTNCAAGGPGAKNQPHVGNKNFSHLSDYFRRTQTHMPSSARKERTPNRRGGHRIFRTRAANLKVCVRCAVCRCCLL